MGELGTALGVLFTPLPFFYVTLGVFLGITVGAIPGLTGAMLIALTLPLTYYMEPTNAVILLVAMYVGAISGGLITATLLRMPGTPAAVMTTFDGYPMARGGQPGRALGLGIAASFVGGLVSWVFLLVLAEPLSIIATRFGPFEYFTLILMAMVLIASVTEGSMVKGLISGLLGMLVSMPGVDPSAGQPRLTWDWYLLNGGLKLLPVLIGVFAVSQIIADVLEINRRVDQVELSQKGILMRLQDWRKQAVNLVRSSLIGTWVGILPGVGASIGSVISYTAAKNMSKTPEQFGTGSEEGIVASEAANNATVGGALIPLIAMGIPGSVIDAILIGALMIHSIQPGPTLFINHADVVWAMIAACLVANVLMFAFMTGSVGFISRLMYLPRAYLLPVVMVFCVIGSYALNNTMFDVWVMLLFGVIGFAMERARMPLGPFVIGFVLAPLAESKLRTGLMMTAGSVEPMFTRPMSLAFLVIAVGLLLWPFVSEWRRGRRTATSVVRPAEPVSPRPPPPKQAPSPNHVERAFGNEGVRKSFRADLQKRAPDRVPEDGGTAKKLLAFLCHAFGDKPRVRELYAKLAASGVEPWLDEKNLLPGQDGSREFARTVRRSDVILVCFSRMSVTKAGHVQKEMRLALEVADEQPEGNVPLILLRLEDCEIPERFRHLQYVDLFDEDGYEKLLNALQSRAGEVGAKMPLDE